jgi:hypothetical protein
LLFSFLLHWGLNPVSHLLGNPSTTWAIPTILFFFYCFIIHMCIQGLGHFSPLPLPPPLLPTILWLNFVFERGSHFVCANHELKNLLPQSPN